VIRGRSEAEPAKWERVKDARGSDMCRCDAARPKRARVQQQEEEEQLRGVQGNDVQGGRARCERSCNAAAAGGPAQGAVESRVEDVGGR
jgi:hypothetical protein